MGTGKRPPKRFSWNNLKRHYAKYSNIAELAISLDAAIFEDGTLLGPDQSNLADHFAEFVRAKQALYRQIAENPEEAFRSIRRIMESAPSIEPGNPLSLYARLAVEGAARWHRRYPDDDVRNLFGAAIRTKPFAIRHPS